MEIEKIQKVLAFAEQSATDHMNDITSGIEEGIYIKEDNIEMLEYLQEIQALIDEVKLYYSK